MLAVLVIILGAGAFVSYKFKLLWWKTAAVPPPSGKELQIHVLDVGQGDSILIISPDNKVMLVDAGDEKNGQTVLDALKRYGVQQIDYFVATHTHPDHIGGASAVFSNFKVANVLWNDLPPPEAQTGEVAANKNSNQKQGKGQAKAQPKPTPRPVVTQHGRPVKFPTVEAYDNFKGAVDNSGAQLKKAEPDQKIDLGGGAIITVLAPIPPPFTREQMISSRTGNESNANSVVMRLDYGDFSMLLTGDAESQTEDRLVGRESNLYVNVLKVAHHGSKYATSDNFLKRVFRKDDAQPKAAVISLSEFNRYGHPSQDVLNRLKAAGVTQLYRTDLQGEITITTTGKVKDGKLFEIKTAKEAKTDLWTGREGTKDDSSRSGFIAYGDYEPPRRQKKK